MPAAAATGTPGVVVAVVLLAAVSHAAWNAIAHGITDQLVSFTLLGVGGALCAVPIVVVSAAPDRRALPYLAVSVALHVLYNLLLMRCYRVGEFSQVYPLARGTSPLVVTVLSVLVVGERLGARTIGGIAAISAGLAGLVFIGRRPDRPALLAAFATGLTIAAYTTVDGLGIRRSGGTGGYTGWLMLTECVALPLVAVARRRGRLLHDVRGVWWRGLLGGTLSVLAYGLVLWAQTRGALAPIAALRESSIVVGALLGTVFFGERFGRARIVAAGLVLAGIVLIS